MTRPWLPLTSFSNIARKVEFYINCKGISKQQQNMYLPLFPAIPSSLPARFPSAAQGGCRTTESKIESSLFQRLMEIPSLVAGTEASL